MDRTPGAIKKDIQSTVEMVNKTYGMKRRKFRCLRHHYLPQKLMYRTKIGVLVPSSEHKADIFTKSPKKTAFARQLSILKKEYDPGNRGD